MKQKVLSAVRLTRTSNNGISSISSKSKVNLTLSQQLFCFYPKGTINFNINVILNRIKNKQSLSLQFQSFIASSRFTVQLFHETS